MPTPYIIDKKEAMNAVAPAELSVISQNSFSHSNSGASFFLHLSRNISNLVPSSFALWRLPLSFFGAYALQQHLGRLR